MVQATNKLDVSFADLSRCCCQTEEEKMLIEKRAREAEIIASRIVDECERR